MKFMFQVSADHVSPDYQADSLPVEVSANLDRSTGRVSFYASASKYGCGKDSTTPIGAIDLLFSDNGCRNIRAVMAGAEFPFCGLVFDTSKYCVAEWGEFNKRADCESFVAAHDDSADRLSVVFRTGVPLSAEQPAAVEPAAVRWNVWDLSRSTVLDVRDGTLKVRSALGEVDDAGRTYVVNVDEFRAGLAHGRYSSASTDVTLYLNGRRIPESQKAELRAAVLAAYEVELLAYRKARAAKRRAAEKAAAATHAAPDTQTAVERPENAVSMAIVANPDSVPEIKRAFDMGTAAARNVLPGATFMGAFSAADSDGYTTDGPRSVFRGVYIAAFLAILPREIVTDPNGVVLSCGKARELV